MNSIIPMIFFIIIFLLFAIKRQYIEIIIMLIIMLIMDFVVVKGFATTPFFGPIAISVGQPLIDILIYAIVKLIIMGLYYLLLQKNNIIAIVVYLLVNILFNQLYMTLSGNIFIDLIFNLISSVILLVAYNKFNYLNDLKWFAIIAVIIDFVLQFSISSIFFA